MDLWSYKKFSSSPVLKYSPLDLWSYKKDLLFSCLKI